MPVFATAASPKVAGFQLRPGTRVGLIRRNGGTLVAIGSSGDTAKTLLNLPAEKVSCRRRSRSRARSCACSPTRRCRRCGACRASGRRGRTATRAGGSPTPRRRRPARRTRTTPRRCSVRATPRASTACAGTPTSSPSTSVRGTWSSRPRTSTSAPGRVWPGPWSPTRSTTVRRPRCPRRALDDGDGQRTVEKEPVARRVRGFGNGAADARRGPLDRVGEDPLDLGVVVDGIVLVARAEVEDPPAPRWKQQPLRNTSPPSKLEMNTSSSGSGMSKCSPYISWASMTIGCGTPAAIGCDGVTVQTSSRSPSLRHGGCTRCRAGAGGSWSSGPSAGRAGPCRRARRRARG